MNRMLSAIVVCAVLAAGSDSDAAFADLAKLPPDVQRTTAYLTTSTVAPEHREQLANVLRFIVPSLSSKSYLADQIPVAIEGTSLLRLDLAGLGWEKVWPKVIAERYTPLYRPDLAAGTPPLVVSGLWVAAVLTDPEQSGDAQYQLLYSGAPPKNEREFKAFWKVNDAAELNFGRIEGASGVNVQSTRLIENHATAIRGYHWQTYDSRVVSGQTDPLENITARPPKHDASELIVGIPKHLGSRAGTLHAFFLSDGKGDRQEKAPADIVVDNTQTRGVEIKNTIGCIGCHNAGLLNPTLDQYRSYILSGARIGTYDKPTQQEIDRYLDSPIAKEIARNNADYAEGLALCNGLTPQQNAQAFTAMVQLYDAPVSPEQAAREVYATPEQWRLALGDYSRTYKLTGRLALMAQGTAMSRQQWIENFRLAQQVIYAWHAQ